MKTGAEVGEVMVDRVEHPGRAVCNFCSRRLLLLVGSHVATAPPEEQQAQEQLD